MKKTMMNELTSSNRMKKQWYFICLILFMSPLAGIGIDLYAPSLPWVAKALHVKADLIRLTMAMYLLGFALGPLLFGPLSDTYGRKKILVVGLVLYVMTCLLIIEFANIWVMLLMRFVQGFTAGGVGVISKAIITDTYTPGAEMISSLDYLLIGMNLDELFKWSQQR